MKEKIIERLKAKHSGLNLSKTRMDAIADRLSAKITKEEDIDAKLDELNEIMPFAEIAKQDDKLRTLEAKSKEKPKEEAKDDEVEEEEEKPAVKRKKKDEEPPAWAKGLIETVTSLQQEKVQKTISAKVDAKLKEKKLPSYLAKYVKVEKEEEIDDIITQLEEDHLAEQQASNDTALSGGKPPKGGKNGETVKPTKEQIDAILS